MLLFQKCLTLKISGKNLIWYNQRLPRHRRHRRHRMHHHQMHHQMYHQMYHQIHNHQIKCLIIRNIQLSKCNNNSNQKNYTAITS